MTQAFDAATAACRIILEIHHRRTAEDFAAAALRAALPAEPPIDYLYGCYTDGMSESNAREAWRHVRAYILGDIA